MECNYKFQFVRWGVENAAPTDCNPQKGCSLAKGLHLFVMPIFLSTGASNGRKISRRVLRSRRGYARCCRAGCRTPQVGSVIKIALFRLQMFLYCAYLPPGVFWAIIKEVSTFRRHPCPKRNSKPSTSAPNAARPAPAGWGAARPAARGIP